MLSDMSDTLTATLLSEGDEGRGRVITSQRTDQGGAHEGTDSLCEYFSGSLIAARVYFFFKAVKCARDTVGLAQRYSSTSIFQKVDFGAGRERERRIHKNKHNGRHSAHTHTHSPHLNTAEQTLTNNYSAIPPTDQHSSTSALWVRPAV